jgi:hypothetical protein
MHTGGVAELIRPVWQSLLPADAAPKIPAQVSTVLQAGATAWETICPPEILARHRVAHGSECAAESQIEAVRSLVFSRLHLFGLPVYGKSPVRGDDCQWTTRRALFVSEI